MDVNIDCDMKKNNIKDRVIAVLKAKGLNVNKASKLFGMPQRTLNRQVNEDGKIAMELMYSILDSFPEISPLWLIMGEGDMWRDSNIQQEFLAAPFFSDMPVSAGLRDAFDPSSEKASGYISLPSQNANFYFPVSGTSMEPEVFSGDIVGVVRVEPYDKISPESIYMIVTNESRMIKHCYIDENNPELLWCVSPNYPSFPINRADICAMFRVVSRIQYF
jgi:hypothetical protein